MMHYRLTDSSRQRIARTLYASLEEEIREIVEECLEDEDDDEVDDSEDYEEEDSEEEIEGGLADEEDPEKYDLEQLLKGIEVEFEHTDEPEVALEIAMDHLEEQDDYYDELAKMEDKVKKESHKVAQGESYEELIKAIASEVRAEMPDYDPLEQGSDLILEYINREFFFEDYQNSLGVLLNSPNASDDGTPIAAGDLQMDEQEGWPSLIKEIAKRIAASDVIEILEDLYED